MEVIVKLAGEVLRGVRDGLHPSRDLLRLSRVPSWSVIVRSVRNSEVPVGILVSGKSSPVVVEPLVVSWSMIVVSEPEDHSMPSSFISCSHFDQALNLIS